MCGLGTLVQINIYFLDTVDIEDIEDIVGAVDIVDTGVRVFGSLVVQVVQVAVPGAVQQWALGGTWAPGTVHSVGPQP